MNNNIHSHNRIHSLDALRAFTLIGILFVHTSQLFNYNNLHNDIAFTNIDQNAIYLFIEKYLTSRFRIIFSFLFGISFYLLTNNSYYTRKKFVWRCIILTLIGIVNKLFFTTDILFMYGICGIMMLPFLKLKINKILCIALFIWGIKFVFYYNNIQIIDHRDFGVRYLIHENFINVIQYPINYAITDYMTNILPFSVTDTLSYFLIGYVLAYYGVIYKLDNLKIYNKYGIVLIITTIIFGGLFHIVYDTFIRNTLYVLMAISYSYIFVCFYNYTKKHFIHIKVLEQMGKCGLTNYTIMDFLGVLFISSYVFKYKLTFNYIICVSFVLTIFLLLSSNLWLKYHKNGPLESLWRKMTNMCFNYFNDKTT